MSIKLQNTKKQHYIPKFYLKLFSDVKGFLEVFDKEINEFLKPKSIKSIGWKDYFYSLETGKEDEIGQVAEKYLGEWENIIAPKIQPIIQKIIQDKHITIDDKWWVAALLSLIWLRGPGMRQQLNDIDEEWEKQTSISREIGNATHLRMLDMIKEFADLFQKQHWSIYVSKCERMFVTVDNPVTEYFLDPKTIYGTPFLRRTHYFSLTPDILIICNSPKRNGIKTIHKKTIFDENHFVFDYNIFASSFESNKRIYSKNAKEIEKVINASMISKQKIFNEYITKTVKF